MVAFKMIKNTPKLKSFYRKLIEKENISHKQALAIYEALFAEAVSLGIFNSDNIMDGIEVDIRIAKAINSLTS
jgi:hypothetical protein